MLAPPDCPQCAMENTYAGGDHEVDCRMDGGSLMLKACFLEKNLSVDAAWG